MGSEEVSLKTHWLVRLVALILVLSGLAELLGGGYLIALGGDFPTSVIPTTIVLDRSHRVAAVFLKSLVAEELQTVVERVAKEQQ